VQQRIYVGMDTDVRITTYTLTRYTTLSIVSKRYMYARIYLMVRQGDRWQPRKLDRERVASQLASIRYNTGALETSFSRDSTNLDIDYNNLFSDVEELYMLMRLDLLAQDNQRRKKAHFRKVDNGAASN
jgi:hypothetical protein